MPITTEAEHRKSVELWREEKDFFTRWCMGPAEPQLLGVIESFRPRAFADLGCGGAPYLKIFIEQGLRVMGCDVSPMAIRAQGAVVPPDRLFEGDLFQFQPTERFDVALARGVLYYYSPDEKIAFLERRAPLFIDKAIIVVEMHVAQPERATDYRGIPMYYENWDQLGRRLKRWSVRLVELTDPLFYTRYIQRRVPHYKPSAEILRNTTRIMILEPKR